jgi:hypothetical protein
MFIGPISLPIFLSEDGNIFSLGNVCYTIDKSIYQVVLIELLYSQDPHMCFVFFNTTHKAFRYLCTVKALRSLLEYTHATYILQAVRILTFWLRDAPTSLTFNNCTFCPHSIYVCCKQRLNATYSINWLVL